MFNFLLANFKSELEKNLQSLKGHNKAETELCIGQNLFSEEKPRRKLLMVVDDDDTCVSIVTCVF